MGHARGCTPCNRSVLIQPPFRFRRKSDSQRHAEDAASILNTTTRVHVKYTFGIHDINSSHHHDNTSALLTTRYPLYATHYQPFDTVPTFYITAHLMLPTITSLSSLVLIDINSCMCYTPHQSPTNNNNNNYSLDWCRGLC